MTTLTTDQSIPVVLLHGLGRGPWSMALLGRRLSKAGFTTHNIGYPSRPQSLDSVLDELDRELRRRGLADAERVHWAGYSLGGLIARAYLQTRRPQSEDRLVMMAPPNNGTEIVDTIGHLRVFRLAFGDLATRLGTARDSLPRQLPPPTVETGVIAGNRWINLLGGWLLDSDHDGTVTVESTKVEGLADHVVLPHTHTFLMNSARVATETAHFLRQGRFSSAAKSRAA